MTERTTQETASQFAWRIVGGGRPYPAPHPAHGARCWLCGGETGGRGWPVSSLPPTFTNHNQARAQSSDTICEPCMAMAAKDTWETYVAEHPEMHLKTGHAMSWRCYSHVFSEGWGHECPSRARWRAILLEPPPPPFLLVMAVSGQKHLIFRARVAHDREHFPLQFEEMSVLIHRELFRRVLSDFELGLALGLSRDALLTGRYEQSALRKLDIDQWRACEWRLRPWRRKFPAWMQIARQIAAKPGGETP